MPHQEATMTQSLRTTLLNMSATQDKHELTLSGLDFTIYYDEQPSRGDRGELVPGSVTGDFEVAVGPLVGGEGVIFRQHVSPTGQGSDTKGYAVDLVIDAIYTRARKAQRA